MKKTILALAAALAICAPALAASDASAPAPQTQAEKDGLTVEQALTITAGLQQLVKYEAVDKENKPYTAYYDFSADLRLTMAIDIDMGRKLQTQFQAAQNDLILQWADPKTGQVSDAKRNAFTVESQKLLSAPSRIGFYHIKKEDLKLDKNPIPGPTLSMIIAIVDR